MLKHKDHFHGSDLEKIQQIYHIKKEEIISFSANVNPLGISANSEILSPGIWTPSLSIRTGNIKSFGSASPSMPAASRKILL